MRNNNLDETIKYIVKRCLELKNKFTNINDVPIEWLDIFCQNEDEFKQFNEEVAKLAKVVSKTDTGDIYFLDKAIQTESGPLRLIKIRKVDPNRKERGDTDFNTNYEETKKSLIKNPKVKLIKRKKFEMLRLSDKNFDVMVCFSNIPQSKILGLKKIA